MASRLLCSALSTRCWLCHDLPLHLHAGHCFTTIHCITTSSHPITRASTHKSVSLYQGAWSKHIASSSLHGKGGAGRDKGTVECSSSWGDTHASLIKALAPTQAATEQLASLLAACRQAGDVICLHGPVGSGKTVFRYVPPHIRPDRPTCPNVQTTGGAGA